MKKILCFALVATFAAIMFNSCENDEIGVDRIQSHREQYYPEPYTTWSGTIDNVKTEMGKYELSSGDLFQMDAFYTDGHSELKWFLYFFGKNPYETSNNIVYLYCFGNATSDLKAVQVVLYNIDFSDISAQLGAHGYTYDEYNTLEYYHTFHDSKTSVKVYVPTSTNKNYVLMYQRIGDTDVMVPFELQ